MIANESYLTRIGLAFDEMMNVVWLNGVPDETVSPHCALANEQGKRWGCIACRILSVVVERDHCAKQIVPVGEAKPTPTLSAIRAFVALLTLLIPFAAAWEGVKHLWGLYL